MSRIHAEKGSVMGVLSDPDGGKHHVELWVYRRREASGVFRVSSVRFVGFGVSRSVPADHPRPERLMVEVGEHIGVLTIDIAQDCSPVARAVLVWLIAPTEIEFHELEHPDRELRFSEWVEAERDRMLSMTKTPRITE